MTKPLEGLRVIDVGTRIAAAYSAGTLGELGAEIIKVERPGTGEYLRELGPMSDGYSLMWSVQGRGRKSVTLDLRTPAGQSLFRRLTATADVVCENFRPMTMEKWGIGPTDLASHLVYVRISVFGQDGPYSALPGVDLLGLAYGGLLAATGTAEGSPVKSNVTISDHLTGVFAAKAAVAALYARDVMGTGEGAVIDASLYGSILRSLDWPLAARARLGIGRTRTGNRDPTLAASGVFRTGDDRYVAVAASTDAQLAALVSLLSLHQGSAGSAPDRSMTAAPEIDAALEQWVRARDAADAVRTLLAQRIPAALVRTAADVVADNRSGARDDLVVVHDPVVGPMLQQAPYPRIDGQHFVPSAAPLLGEHNDETWCDLVGLSRDELDGLRRDGVV